MSSQFDAISAQGRVGPQTAGDGAYNALRLDKTGALVVTNAHGRLHEVASRGKLFFVSTPVAGVAPGTVLSTTPPMSIWNPVLSGIIVSIKQVYVGYVSGTLGAGMIVHAVNLSQLTLPSGGTELIPQCAILNGTRGSARVLTGSTLSGTPVIVRPSMSLGAALASSVSFQFLSVDPVEGSIIIPPGCAYAYQAVAAAGTTPLLAFGIVYEEVTLPV